MSSDTTNGHSFRIVRPEIFITEQVVGVLVPDIVIENGRPASKWVQVLHWSDGKRETKDFTESLNVSGIGTLFFEPVPRSPTIGTRAGWSKPSRQGWIGGTDGTQPKPTPRSAADVFGMIASAIDDYLYVDENRREPVIATLTLWVLLTYLYPAWPAVPYLYVGGVAGSGKSRLFELLAKLAFRPLSSSNMTAPAMFRTLHDTGGTMLLDEAERLKANTPDAEELRSILLAGYKAGGVATRLKSETFETQHFSVYGPKAIAAINGLPEALATRVIPIILSRSLPGSEKASRRIDADEARWTSTRDAIHELVMESLGFASLRLSEDSDACPFSARDYELWQPLLALARHVERDGIDGLHDAVLSFARAVTENANTFRVNDADELLLRALAKRVAAGERPTASELLADVKEVEYETFVRWTARTVSEHLSRFNLFTRKSNNRRVFSATLDELKRIQVSYGIDLEIN